ncbi:MAG: DUF2334 domain-containing protein [Acidobacteriota bacterium]|nr:DUF2334 domain-containing protein [Acidobacteriota bacterium]
MNATYLLRFDDICPTMNWEAWEQVERILIEEGIDPILAVVPDNKDEELRVSAPRSDFWARVRTWRKRNWSVAMHGWQHLFVTPNAGLLGVNRRSEFAGLERARQEDKLRRGLAVFEREQVATDLWVAPAHSFDQVTVDCLADLGFRYISDGFCPYPAIDTKGIVWLPQQLWSFRRRPFGVWTICFHLNKWDRPQIAGFQRRVREFRRAITSVEDVAKQYAGNKQSKLNLAMGKSYRLVAVTKSIVEGRSRQILSRALRTAAG